jgi:hypothetical protein
MWLTALVGNQCKVLGVSPWTRFTDDTLLVEGTPYGAPGVWLEGSFWYVKSSDTIVVQNRSLSRFPDDMLRNAARHECCHALYKDRRSSVEVEERAEKCARERF